MRLAAGVEYEGTAYAGWQRQHHARSVQGEVEAALSRVADQTIATTCAGRTDAGVHALGQVIHFDTTASRANDAWLLGANSHLPSDISLRWVSPMPDEFHARYSARARRYRYVIFNHRSRPALYAHRACWFYHPLDAMRMHEAAQHLLGEHDFSAYRAAECQSRSPNRFVEEITVTRQGNWVAIEIEANAFLHHMVRNIAGVLMAIGKGSQPIDWTRTVLEGRDRQAAGVTAAAEGLYFLRVRYDTQFQLPSTDDPGFGLLP